MFVIAIHISPLEGVTGTWTFWFDPVLIRLAVPLFFAMSGMGLFGKLQYANGKIVKCRQNRQRLLRYLTKIAVLYLGWSAVFFLYSLPGWYEIGWWGWTLVKDYAVAFFFQGSHYHLWYLVALLYAVPMLYLVLLVIPKQKIIYLITPLWLAECALTSYAWVGADTLPAVVSKLFTIVPCPIHAVFRGIPLLAVGMMTEDRIGGFAARTSGILTAIFGLLYVAEETVLYYGPFQSAGGTYLLSTPVFIFFALQFMQRSRQICSIKTGKVLRYGSMLVYCVHPLIIYVCQAVIPDELPYVQWALVTAISALIGLGYGMYRCKYKIKF